MILDFIMGMPTIRFIDILDIVIVAALIYYVYRMAQGTNIMVIFWAIIIMILLWRLAMLLDMHLLGTILGTITNVGLIALVVIFQPEIRKFLLIIGTKTQIDQPWLKRLRFWRHNLSNGNSTNYEPYINACMHMSQSKTGALIVFKRQNEVEELVATGERINANVSSALLETIFFKNSPLHDGAVFVSGNTIIAARCILPVTSSLALDPALGLRHRSAIGVSEQLDVLSVVVSEQTGNISYAIGGELHHDISPVELRQVLEKYHC